MGEYFSHDYDTTQNSKIICLLGDYGGIGYGMYWRIIELLHQNKDHKLMIKPYVIEAIAKQMLTSAEQVSKFVKDCCDKYELFATDGVSFWSERVFENILHRKSISEVRSMAGRAGAIAKQNLANVSKGKESKVKNKREEKSEKLSLSSHPFIPPTEEEVRSYCIERKNNINPVTFLNHYRSTGWKRGNTKIKDWKACVITWEQRDSTEKKVIIEKRPDEFRYTLSQEGTPINISLKNKADQLVRSVSKKVGI